MFLRFNLFTILWAFVIFLLILMPGRQMPQTFDLFSFDKIAHFGVFMVLSFIMITGFAKQFTYTRLRRYHTSYGLAVSASYAALLEISQHFAPDRQISLLDLAANIAGVLFGYLLFLLIYKLSFG